MNVSVQLTGVLKHSELGRDFSLDVDEGSTAQYILEYLEYPSEHHRFITVFINGQQVDTDTLLSGGDEVKLFLPVGGG